LAVRGVIIWGKDWRLGFLPCDHALEIPEGERIWLIERKFSFVIIRVESK